MGSLLKTAGKVTGKIVGATPLVGKRMRKASNALHGIKSKKKGSGTVLAEGFAPGPTSQFK